jgi:hypothetical protein
VKGRLTSSAACAGGAPNGEMAKRLGIGLALYDRLESAPETWASADKLHQEILAKMWGVPTESRKRRPRTYAKRKAGKKRAKAS